MEKLQSSGLIFLISFIIAAFAGPTDDNEVTHTSESSVYILKKRHYIQPDDQDSAGIVTKKYEIINRGNSEVKILNVNPHCSCTGYDLTSELLSPGDTSYLSLSVSYDQLKTLQKTYATIRLDQKPKFLLAEMRIKQ